eukprot:14411008-Alexandrium_andersonii.AAC.1
MTLKKKRSETGACGTKAVPATRSGLSNVGGGGSYAPSAPKANSDSGGAGPWPKGRPAGSAGSAGK